MAKTPKKDIDVEGDPKRGDVILKRMLQTKPKPHSEMAKGRKTMPKPKGKTGRK